MGELNIELRYSAGTVRGCNEGDVAPPNIDVGMMIHFLRFSRDGVHCSNCGEKIGKGVSARKTLTGALPSRERGELLRNFLCCQETTHGERVADFDHHDQC